MAYLGYLFTKFEDSSFSCSRDSENVKMGLFVVIEVTQGHCIVVI